MKKENITILIPARMESSRFPGKPLAPIEGLPMIVYCAKNAIDTGLKTYVCTDSKEIKTVCDLYNIKSFLTQEFNTGTDRIASVIEKINCEYVINLQGDEPLIDTNSLNNFINEMKILEQEDDLIISGVSSVKSEQAFDPNNVKCAILQKSNYIQYFSRKPLLNSDETSNLSSYYKQLGLYGMSKESLKKFTSMKQGTLELAEKVELMRWLEDRNKIYAAIIDCDSISVDTPQDLVDVIEKLKLKS